MESTPLSACIASTCAFCQGDNCNGIIYPVNRIQCHHCSDNTNDCRNGLTTEQKVCNNYIAGDACYTTYSSDKTMVYRGCMSDADGGSQFCGQNGDATCTRCLLTGCNSLPAVTSASLSCVHCSATDDDNEWGCGYGYESTDAQQCESRVWLGQTESCYTVRGAEGVSRGCTLDNVEECSASATCEQCTTSACNSKSYDKFKCYQCNSSAAGQGSCAKEAEDIEVTECPGEDQKLVDLGCYLWKKEDDSVERGCVSSLDTATKNVCKDEDSESCEVCIAEGCNNQNAGAAALMAFSTIALLVVAFVVHH